MNAFFYRLFVGFTTLSWVLLSLSSCTTDVTLEGPAKDIPIAYGLLDGQDSVFTVQLFRAFQTNGQDAKKIAIIPDSLYYPDHVTVWLERKTTKTRAAMQPRQYPARDTGIFATSPNRVYQIPTSALNATPGETVKLYIARPNLDTVTAETRLLQPSLLSNSSPAQQINWLYDRFININWQNDPEAAVFDVTFFIHILENSGQGFVPKTLTWTVARNIENTQGSNRQSYPVRGDQFYQVIAAAFKDAPVAERIFSSIDLEIKAGGKDYLQYLKTGQTNTGITSSQQIPVYTNLSEGRGILSAVTTSRRENMGVSGTTLDSLRNGIYTRQLGFK